MEDHSKLDRVLIATMPIWWPFATVLAIVFIYIVW